MTALPHTPPIRTDRGWLPQPGWSRRVGWSATLATLLLSTMAACSGYSVPDAASTDPGDGLAPVTVTGSDGNEMRLPPGWTASVWARVRGARMQAWTPGGDLLVTDDRGGTVHLLHPGTTGAAPSSAVLLDGLDRPQGIAVTQRDGLTLIVVAEQTRIVRYTLRDTAATDPRVLVGNLPGAGQHYGKFVTISPDGAEVYFNIGSSSDNDVASRTGTPARATIERVPLDGGAASVVAVGVRNGEGLAFAPDGTLFTAINQVNDPAVPVHEAVGDIADAYGRTGTAWALEHPADPITRVSADLGWPYCVPDDRHGLQNMPYLADPETNDGGRTLDCATLPAVQTGLPAHSAPIGLHFVTLDGTPGAIVAAHGSYRRQPPREPAVYFLPWDAARGTLGAARPLAAGFQLADGTRWGRPVDVTVGPDGAWYVTDDAAGAVYRLHE